MADPFEHDLVLMLDEPLALEGEDAFAAGVEARIERAWRLRRWGFGLAALAGGGVSIAAMARAHLGLGALNDALSASAALRSGLQGADVTWLLAAGLVALAVVALPRLFEES